MNAKNAKKEAKHLKN